MRWQARGGDHHPSHRVGGQVQRAAGQRAVRVQQQLDHQVAVVHPAPHHQGRRQGGVTATAGDKAAKRSQQVSVARPTIERGGELAVRLARKGGDGPQPRRPGGHEGRLVFVLRDRGGRRAWAQIRQVVAAGHRRSPRGCGASGQRGVARGGGHRRRFVDEGRPRDRKGVLGKQRRKLGGVLRKEDAPAAAGRHVFEQRRIGVAIGA